MSCEGFRVRLIRMARVGARTLVAGAEIEVDALTALDLLMSHRAVLCDVADLTILAEMAPRPVNGATITH